MKWFLDKLSALGADPKTLTTHDAVHGAGAKWQKERYEKRKTRMTPPSKG